MLSTNMNKSFVWIVLLKRTDFVSMRLNNDLYVEAMSNVPMLYSDVQQGQLHSPSDINGKSEPLSYVVFISPVYMYKQTVLTINYDCDDMHDTSWFDHDCINFVLLVLLQNQAIELTAEKLENLFWSNAAL